MDLIDRQEVDKIIDDLLENDNLQASPSVWHGLHMIKQLPSAQSEIIRCKDCKYWMPYDWMFSEVCQSQNMDDYSVEEIGCQYCDMSMKADDFCSRAERRSDE